jgi:hypothetical protein
MNGSDITLWVIIFWGLMFLGFLVYFFAWKRMYAKDSDSLFYLCPYCGNKIYWSKSTPIPDRTCPQCGKAIAEPKRID